MKKLLIYYPKNPSSLMPIISEITSNLALANKSELYQRIIHRYKHDLFLQQAVDMYRYHLDVPIWGKCRTSRALRLSEDDTDFVDANTFVIRKAIKSNKWIRSFELDSSIDDSLKILSRLRSLKSLNISYLPKLSVEDFEKALIASRLSLENITISGTIRARNAVEMVRNILELPKLKRFNFDCNFPPGIDRIPFKALQKRDISYDIRLYCIETAFEFSLVSELGLRDLDLLAINCKNIWLTSFPKWDWIEEEFTGKQEMARRSLFLDISDRFATELSKLFVACKNIRILHITLSQETQYGKNAIGYQSLKYLSKLEHIFIELGGFTSHQMASVKNLPDQAHDLFDNLKYCAPKLKSVSFHLYGESDPQNCRQALLAFFEACADTLIEITFKVTFDTYSTAKNTKIFYTALSKLKEIKCLKLIYEGFSDESFKVHSINLQSLLLNQKIREMYMSAPGISSEFITLNLVYQKHLEKLSLVQETFNSSELLKTRTHLQNSLKFIEITLNKIDKEVWYILTNTMDFFKALETLKLKIGDLVIPPKIVVEELKSIVKKHQSLNLIAFCQENDPLTINIITNGAVFYSETDIENFFGRGLDGLPKKRCLRRFFV